jgi:hypothetical protein
LLPRSLEGGSLHRAGAGVDAVSLSADGRVCVTGGRDGRIGVVDVVAGRAWALASPGLAPGLAPHPLPLSSVRVDVARRPALALAAGLDGAVRVWDLRAVVTGTAVGGGAGAGAGGGAASPASAVAATLLGGSPVWSFSLAPAFGRAAAELAPAPPAALATAHVAEGGGAGAGASGLVLVRAPGPLASRDAIVVSGHEDGAVRAWDARPTAAAAAAAAAASVAFGSASDGDGSGGVNSGILLPRPAPALIEPLYVLDGHGGAAVTCLAVLDGGGALVSGGADGSLRLWTLRAGRAARAGAGNYALCRSLPGHDGPVAALAIAWAGGARGGAGADAGAGAGAEADGAGAGAGAAASVVSAGWDGRLKLHVLSRDECATD